MPERYLSLPEAAMELGISEPQVRKLLKSKMLVGIQIPDTRKSWRILDPAPALRRQLLEPKIDDFPVISRREIAEIMDLSPKTVTWYAVIGNLSGIKSERGSQQFHSVRQVRDFLAFHEKRRGRSKHTYSSIIVDWLKRYLDELKPNGEIIDRLVKEAIILPEPARSQMVFKLWTLFDQVNELLKECQKR